MSRSSGNIKTIPSFPSIVAVGSKYSDGLFDGVVEITEKVDGSMFGFGHGSDGKLVIRSKSQELTKGNHPTMFRAGVEYVCSIKDKILALPRGTFIYGEYLQRPKHNVLSYDRVPQNNIIVFGVKQDGKMISDYDKIKLIADHLELETVPLIFRGEIIHADEFSVMLDRISILGKVKIEGIVVKNYLREHIYKNGEFEPMFGKYVSSQFKEVKAAPRQDNRLSKLADMIPEGNYEGIAVDLFTYAELYKTEARVHKAIQHLHEADELELEPRDIPKVLKEVARDIDEECALDMMENVREILRSNGAKTTNDVVEKVFKDFRKTVHHRIGKMVPTLYKLWLVERSFDAQEEEILDELSETT